MKRAMRSLLLTAIVTAGVIVPSSSASAATCIGVYHDESSGTTRYGRWNCSPCPELTYGPLDGRVWVIACIDSN